MKVLQIIRQFAFLVILVGALLPAALPATPHGDEELCPDHWCDMESSCQYGGGPYWQYWDSQCEDIYCQCTTVGWCLTSDDKLRHLCDCEPCEGRE